MKPLHLKTIALLIIAFFTLAAAMSCESKSGKLDRVKPEKVMIIDSYPRTNLEYLKYKVKRIEQGVVTEIYDKGIYEQGDTIFHKFL